MTSNKNKDLMNRLIILEKFLELKSNECAYYRTKVHLMQISSINSSIKPKDQNNPRSSSEDISQNQSNSIEKKHRRSSVPLSFQRKSNLKKVRKKKKISAQNQNYYEEIPSHSNQKFTSTINEKNLIEQIIISYINKHLQQSVAHDKNIQCNDNDFHPIEPSSSKFPNTTLMIRLPRRFVKSLIAQQKKPTTPKLKVHLSSELLKKLFQSISKENQLTIQSQFGTISACVNQKDKQQSKAIHVKAEVKTDHDERLPIIRHTARTRSDVSERKQILIDKSRHYRRPKRHLHKSSSTSYEEINSKKSSLTNVTQTIETLPSSNQTSNSISIKRRF